jgi:hypothetical protein
MLVGRCSSELSSHKLQAKLKKSQPPSAAEGSAVFLSVSTEPKKGREIEDGGIEKT